MTEEPMDVHVWFGLTYANYLVLRRSVLQSMPLEWQWQFVALLTELEERCAAAGITDPPGGFCVQARGHDGRFVRDPLSEYRHMPNLLRNKGETDE